MSIFRYSQTTYRPLSGKQPNNLPASSAIALALFGFGRYTFPLGTAGAMAFYDPLEGTETI